MIFQVDNEKFTGYNLNMTANEKLILYHILEKAGFVVCEEKDDVDPRIISVKLWHEKVSNIDFLDYCKDNVYSKDEWEKLWQKTV
jgi:hypothetical protein